MPLPFGYKILPGPPTAPPPQGQSYAPGTNGVWYSYPTPGVDNSVLYGGSPAQVASPSAAAPTAAYQPPTTGLLGIIGTIDKDIPALGYLDDLFDLNPNTSGSITATNGPIAAASAGLAFITDIPRVVTTLLGMILIIVGLFALAKGPAVQVIGSAVRDAATS